MTRMPISFAEEAPPRPRRWTILRVLVWLTLFVVFGFWIVLALLR